MDRNTTDFVSGTVLVGEFDVKVVRADGRVERKRISNTLTYKGLNRIAHRANAYTNTAAAYLVIGTATNAGSLGSDVSSVGEVGRKIGAASVQSREWFSVQATWAGDTDGLTGVALDAVALADIVDSGQGIIFNHANGLAVTLQASDFLNLTGRIRVGSHDVGHST